MSRAMEDVYVAGHFWKMLPYSLNWANKKSQARRIAGFAKTDKTPSWSWASMDGMLDFHNLPGSERFAEIEAYTLSLVNETNPAGQVSFATLKIRAPIDEMKHGRMKALPFLGERNGPNGRDILVSMDDPRERIEREDGLPVAYLCMAKSAPNCYLQGLVLRKLQTEGDEYQRVGYFSVVNPPYTWETIAQLERKLLTLV
jgi:hypothetical protein